MQIKTINAFLGVYTFLHRPLTGFQIHLLNMQILKTSLHKLDKPVAVNLSNIFS